MTRLNIEARFFAASSNTPLGID